MPKTIFVRKPETLAVVRSGMKESKRLFHSVLSGVFSEELSHDRGRHALHPRDRPWL